MRNDRKRPPARDLVGKNAHQSASAIPGMPVGLTIAAAAPDLRWI
jgi:hypothetical protein